MLTWWPCKRWLNSKLVLVWLHEGAQRVTWLTFSSLIYWRKARLSNVVSLRNIYRPTEQLDLSRLPVVAETYGRKFSTLPPLISVLARLREARPFVEALQIPASQSRRSAYLEMLVWLLSQKLVVELRVFYRLVANTEIKWRATQGEPSRLQTRVSSDDVAGSAPGPLAASKGHSASLTDSPTSSQFLSTPLESPARPNTFTHRQSSALSGISEDQLQNTTTSTASPVPIPGQMPRQTSGVSGMSGPTSPSFHSHDGPTSASSSSFNETSIISEPGEASHVERMWLQKMTEGRPPDIVTGFQRCVGCGLTLTTIDHWKQVFRYADFAFPLATRSEWHLSSTEGMIGRKSYSEAVSLADN